MCAIVGSVGEKSWNDFVRIFFLYQIFEFSEVTFEEYW